MIMENNHVKKNKYNICLKSIFLCQLLLYKSWKVPDIKENYIVIGFFLPLHAAFERVCNVSFFEIFPAPHWGWLTLTLENPQLHSL